MSPRSTQSSSSLDTTGVTKPPTLLLLSQSRTSQASLIQDNSVSFVENLMYLSI